ncbi:MAG: photosystem II stability/assembly factor-like uncharacterized protein, partial [Pseudohongiellaceae bacterium]
MFTLAPAPLAHVPHDVMNEVALSPDFANDQTVFGAFVFIDQIHFGRSVDGGRNWDQRQLPMAQHTIKAFAFSPNFSADGRAFCATGQGVYRTFDRGLTWQPSNSGLSQLITSDIAVSPQFATDNTLVVATRTGAFRSIDGGDSWQQSLIGLSETKFEFVSFTTGAGETPVAFLGGKRLHRSDDLGQSWQALHDFGTAISALSASPSFAADDTLVVALAAAGIHGSTDGGSTFSPSSAGLSDLATTDIAFTPSGTLLATSAQGVWQASAAFQSWTPQVSGLQALDPLGSPNFRGLAVSPNFAVDSTVLLASFEGCYRSLNGGSSWLVTNSLHQQLVKSLLVSPSFASDRLVYASSPGAGLLAWRVPLPALPPSPGKRATRAQVSGAGLLTPSPVPVSPALGNDTPAFASDSLEARSTGLGSLWNEGLAISPNFAEDNTLFFAYIGTYRSTDRGNSWTKLVLPAGGNILRDIAVSPDFAFDNTIYGGSNGNGFFRSSDRGDTWVSADGGLPSDFKTRRIQLSPDFAQDQTIFAASWNHGLWKSSSAGVSWLSSGAGIPQVNMQSLALSPNFGNDGTVLVGEKPGRLWRSFDRGATWQTADTGLPSSDAMIVTDIAFSPQFARDQMVAAATGDGAIWLSTDGADSWQLLTQSTRGTVRSLEFAAEGSAAGLLIAAAPPQLLALRPLSPSATEQVEAIS